MKIRVEISKKQAKRFAREEKETIVLMSGIKYNYYVVYVYRCRNLSSPFVRFSAANSTIKTGVKLYQSRQNSFGIAPNEVRPFRFYHPGYFARALVPLRRCFWIYFIINYETDIASVGGSQQ